MLRVSVISSFARRLARAAGKTASNAETDATHTSLAKDTQLERMMSNDPKTR